MPALLSALPIALAVLLAVHTAPVHAQSMASVAADVTGTARTTFNAHFVAESISIDGRLDEEAWWEADVVTDFLQLEPNEGAPPSMRTEVRVLYGTSNLYIGAVLYDDNPDQIRATLGRRDFVNNADWFIVSIDSHFDRKTAYVFGVNAAGVQYDGFRSAPFRGPNEGSDSSWDAIWESDVRVTPEGWVVEMRIPYSMLRFPQMNDQTWGMQFIRQIPRLGETAEWPLVRRAERTNLITHYGRLNGLRDIQPRRNVQIRPYTMSRVQTQEHSERPGTTASSSNVDLGGDLKIGLTGSVTLDATINPDFGQVESDPAELNLTAFETFFMERRPFFVEGTQIYNFGLEMRGNLLYTRRIGADAPIIAASKLSGRTERGTSFGMLAATTGHDFDPGRNYGVARLSQEFGQQSSIGAILTGFDGPSDDDRLRSLAGGTDWDLRFLDNNYSVTGFATFTHRRLPHVEPVTGLAGSVSAEKRRGIWNYSLGATLFDDRFNPNDAGLLRRNDFVRIGGRVSHDVNAARPFGPFQRANVFVFGGQEWSYVEGLNQGMNLLLSSNWTLRSFHQIRLSGSLFNPWGGYDLYETRGLGPRAKPLRSGAGIDLRTDDRRTFRLRPQFSFDFSNDGGREYEVGLQANWILGSRISLMGDVELGWENGVTAWSSNESFLRQESGWAIGTLREPPSGLSPGEYMPFDDRGVLDGVFENLEPYAEAGTYYAPVFGARDTRSVDFTVRSNVTFTPNLSLQLYGQLFVARGEYEDFRILRDPDTLVPFDAFPKRDVFTLNSFQVNTVLRWEYRPGSRLYLVWSQGRRHRDLMNPLMSWTEESLDRPFASQLGDAFRIFPTNVFLIKIDYAFLR